MNNIFHRAAVKALADMLDDTTSKRKAIAEFERRLEAQAKAFDACKSGTEISMGALEHEMQKALARFHRQIISGVRFLDALGEFNETMKPHFEIRLW